MEQIEITNRTELYGSDAKYKNCNLFIEAGAGAGKTETIINLIVEQLCQNVPPEKIVAITFTNKATEELKSRIASILVNKINQTEDDLNHSIDPSVKSKLETNLAILKSANSNLFKMNISTIHHFCNVILNENCYKANISFKSVLLEENDEKKRRDHLYYQWFHSLSRTEIKEISESNDDAFKKLKSTFDSLCAQFDDISIEASVPFDIETFWNKLFELYDILNGYSANSALGAYANTFFSGVFSAYSEKETLSPSDLFTKYVTDAFLKLIRADIKIKKQSGSLLSAADVNDNVIGPLAAECVEQKNKVKDYLDSKCYSVINPYAIKAWTYYKETRDRMSLSNNQLIYETYKLLEDPDVKQKLADKYDIIFVDEFQDTDKYQNKFIIDLAIAIDQRKANNGFSSTSLVLVGDPKQSIYGFRGADFKLFMETREKFDSLGLRNAISLYLPDNYRSNNYILDWVNTTYNSKKFYDTYSYQPMKLPTSHSIPTTTDPDILAGVYTYKFSREPKDFNVLASFIKSLVKKGYKIFDRTSENCPLTPRPIKYSDVLVLTTSHSEINQYVQAFNKENINVAVSGEFYLSSSKAFRYIYRIICYLLDNERNNYGLFESDFNAKIYDSDKLNEIKDKVKDYTPYGKMVYVFNNINLILDEFDDSDRNMLATVLSQVCENISYQPTASSVEVLEALKNLIDEPAEEQIALCVNEDAVRIMNVHKAKGLTSQIVIFVDSGGFKNDSGCILYEDKLYMNNSKLFLGVKDGYDLSKEKERLRLEYVAATRAKQVMIFESDIEDKRLFKRDDEEYNLNDLSKYHIDTELPEYTDTPLSEEKTFKKISQTGFSNIPSGQSVPIIKESSPSLLEKSSPHKFTEPVTKYKRPANNIFGTIFHRLMELYIIDKTANKKALIERAVNENIMSVQSEKIPEYKKYLNECLDSVISLYTSSGILEKYAVCEPEFKFCDYDDIIYDGKSTIMTGSIDLLLKNDNEALIIDYKTDTNHYSSKSEFEYALKEKYEHQLGTYKKVINKFFNIPLDNITTKIVWMEEIDNTTMAHFVDI